MAELGLRSTDDAPYGDGTPRRSIWVLGATLGLIEDPKDLQEVFTWSQQGDFDQRLGVLVKRMTSSPSEIVLVP